MTRRLMEGSEAMAEACIAAGLRFFAGYPMTPFTELLEHLADLLPRHGGVCINAESELEAVGMAWGALATGARSATGSTGQGLALMQESFAELALAGLPMVIFDMARGQGDYFQATRGGGHGDYRHIVLAPADGQEASDLTQEAFHLAETWRNPALVMGDYLLAHTWEAVDVAPLHFGDRAEVTWAVDGTMGGTGQSRLVTSLGFDKRGRDHPGMEAHFRLAAERTERIAASGLARAEELLCDDADVVVVAYGSAGRFVRWVVRDLRSEGHRVGCIRPITLWPFPTHVVRTAAERVRHMAVFEINAGQMVDDVRLAVEGRCPVTSIGGISTDASGFGVGSLLEPGEVRRRILDVLGAVPA